MAKKYYLGNIKGPAGQPGHEGLPGPQGDKGDRGEQGPKGETGEAGLRGTDGITYEWLTGATFPSSEDGKKGDLYINIVTQDVYKKTSSEEWVLQCNIKGATGNTGPEGERGDVGPQGDKGDRGEQGQQGETGAVGAKGVDGITYEWLIGEITPSSNLGKKGDMYIDTGTQDVYKKTNSEEWVLQCNIKGDAGIKGDVGPQGDKGDRGEQGPNGEPGERGPIGGGCGVTTTIAPHNALTKSKEVADIVLLGDATDAQKINEAVDLGGEVRILEGTVKCHTTIFIKSNISGLGNCTVFEKCFDGVLFSVQDVSCTTIENFRVEGNSYDGYIFSCLEMQGGKIENIIINDAKLGIEITDCDNLLFYNNRIAASSYCIYLTSSNRLQIDSCFCNSQSGSVLFSANTDFNQCRITKSNFIGNANNVLFLRKFKHSTFTNNYLETSAGTTISVMQICTNNIFSNNILKSSGSKLSITGGNYNLCSGNISYGSITTTESDTIVDNNLIMGS